MAYLRCTECGSKALVAASQCPKCSHPFNLHDARGERVKLKRCRSCGIMHRVDAHCHWCGEQRGLLRLPSVNSAALRSAAAVALMVTAVGGVWQYAPALRELAETVRGERGGAPVAMVATNASVERAPVTPQVVGQAMPADSSTMVATAAGAIAFDSAASVAGGMTEVQASGDANGIVWTPAVARTWVNVRSDASRGGEVVGVIKPASRAMLGTDRAGWRQVRSPDVSGWVDPRLFEPDSLRTRGE